MCIHLLDNVCTVAGPTKSVLCAVAEELVVFDVTKLVRINFKVKSSPIQRCVLLQLVIVSVHVHTCACARVHVGIQSNISAPVFVVMAPRNFYLYIGKLPRQRDRCGSS